MKIGILGTGMVGQQIAGKLADLGHEVTVGTRDVSQTQAKKEPSAMGTPPFSEWHKSHAKVKLATFVEAAKSGEMVFVCTHGERTLDALKLAQPANFKGKTVVDVSNPLDFSKGMPPTLIGRFANTTSLSEEIQKSIPDANVVKSLNIVNCEVMVNPKKTGGDPTMFVAGNEKKAKDDVKGILKQFGWSDVVDLGDLSAARGMEMFVILWVRTMGALKTPHFGFGIIK